LIDAEIVLVAGMRYGQPQIISLTAPGFLVSIVNN
jgi:hypothetical protein